MARRGGGPAAPPGQPRRQQRRQQQRVDRRRLQQDRRGRAKRARGGSGGQASGGSMQVDGFFYCPRRERYFPLGTELSSDEDHPTAPEPASAPVLASASSTAPEPGQRGGGHRPTDQPALPRMLATREMTGPRPGAWEARLRIGAAQSVRARASNHSHRIGVVAFDARSASEGNLRCAFVQHENHGGASLRVARVQGACWAPTLQHQRIELQGPAHVVAWSPGDADGLRPLAWARNGVARHLVHVALVSAEGRPEPEVHPVLAGNGHCHSLAWGREQLILARGAERHVSTAVVRLTDATPSVVLRTVPVPSQVMAQSFADNDRVLLFGCRNGQLMSADLRSRASQQVAPGQARAGAVCWLHPLRFSGDRDVLMCSTSLGAPASTGWPMLLRFDRRRVANARGELQPVVRYEGHAMSHRPANAPGVDASETVLAGVGADNRLRLWDVRRGGKCLSEQAADVNVSEGVHAVLQSGRHGGRVLEAWAIAADGGAAYFASAGVD